MAGISVDIEVKGLEELQKKLEKEALIGNPLQKLLGKAALLVEREAKIGASGRPGPRVRTGRLRASITSLVDTKPIPEWAKVGTNLEYAAPVEYGHGKVPAYPFLHPAFERVKDKINILLDEFRKLVEQHWNK